MKEQTNTLIKAHIIRCLPYLLLLTTGTVMAFFAPQAPRKPSHPAAAGLTFGERVSYQRAIEEVYWRHRLWPKENANQKPSLDAVMSPAEVEKKVEKYLVDSVRVEDCYEVALTAEQLQAEIERM